MNYLIKRRDELVKEIVDAKEVLDYLNQFHISGHVLKSHFEHVISDNQYIVSQIEMHLDKPNEQVA